MAKLTVGLSMIEKPLFLVDYGYNIIKKWVCVYSFEAQR